MNLRLPALLLGCSSLCLVMFFGCSSTTSTGASGNGPDGSVDDGSVNDAGSDTSTLDGATNDPCELEAGTYIIHYTVLGDGGPDCAVDDQTQVVSDTPPDADTAGCTRSEDKATCMLDITCTSMEMGFTSVTTAKYHRTNTSITGTLSTVTSGADGGPVSSCDYDLTWTKQN